MFQISLPSLHILKGKFLRPSAPEQLPAEKVADLNRQFSATQSCDAKVQSARSMDLDMVPPDQR